MQREICILSVATAPLRSEARKSSKRKTQRSSGTSGISRAGISPGRCEQRGAQADANSMRMPIPDLFMHPGETGSLLWNSWNH